MRITSRKIDRTACCSTQVWTTPKKWESSKGKSQGKSKGKGGEKRGYGCCFTPGIVSRL